MVSARKVDEFLQGAKLFKGQAYKWGGGHGAEMRNPGPVDCSGLIMQAAYKADMNLTGTASMQQRMGRRVGMKSLKPGDLVFRGNPAYHAGIYLGGGKVLHAPRTGSRVGIVDAGYFTSARRVFKGLTDSAKAKLQDLRTSFNKADVNRNNRLEPEELQQAPELRNFDTDGNGYLTWEALKNVFTRRQGY